MASSKSGHNRRCGFMAVGLQWLHESFFDLGISHFDLVWVDSFLFFALDEVSLGFNAVKWGVYRPTAW
jgi:hypothetical protein